MLYIHIPFCKSKCIYCDFYSKTSVDYEKYLRAAACELDTRIHELKGGSLSSIYIGGGTPSLLPHDLIGAWMLRIFRKLKNHGIKLEKDAEITIEANPEDITEELCRVWRQSGINRVSLGVQSLIDSELEFLRRRNRSRKTIEAITTVKEYFDNFSVDVIYNIPGQTIESLGKTLETLIGFHPKHISTYSLTYEEGTPLYSLAKEGKIKPTEEMENNLQAKFINSVLKANGFEHYEVSNYALPGYHSRHNSGYWSGKPYLGIGPSAASYDGQRSRKTNHPELNTYISNFLLDESGLKTFYDEEILSDEERLEERIFLSMRTGKGIDLKLLMTDFGEEKATAFLSKCNRWIESGHLVATSDSVAFSEEGLQISDFIISSLI